MKESRRGYIIEATGREVYAHRGILGLSPGDDELFQGYDGTFGEWEVPFTLMERTEIAEFMIAAWQAWGRGDYAAT